MQGRRAQGADLIVLLIDLPRDLMDSGHQLRIGGKTHLARLDHLDRQPARPDLLEEDHHVEELLSSFILRIEEPIISRSRLRRRKRRERGQSHRYKASPVSSSLQRMDLLLDSCMMQMIHITKAKILTRQGQLVQAVLVSLAIWRTDVDLMINIGEQVALALELVDRMALLMVVPS